MHSLSPISLRRLDYLFALLIILFAFSLRVVVTLDRAYGDPLFAPLPAGSDQRTYVNFAERYQLGTWPDGPFYFQPGFVYYLIVTRAVTGTSLGEMRLTYCFVGALACGFLIGAGWLLTRRRWGGYLAGLLLAVYPVAIFYSTELLGEALATFYVCAVVFLALWQRERLALWRSILLGLMIGLCTLARTNLALVGLAWVIWLAISGLPKQRIVVHAAVSFIALAAAIAPVTLYNLQTGNGHFQLITSVGSGEVYRGNSRDSDGTWMKDVPAAGTAEISYEHALMVDIALRPIRFIELQFRKFAIYWSDSEPGNNIDYYINGEAVSPLLRSIPLDFRILSALGLLGLALLLHEDRRMGGFFAALNVVIFVGVMVIWVVSRVRLPAVAPLVMTTAFLLVRVADYVQNHDWHLLVRRLAPSGVFLAGMFVFCNWAIDNLPNKATVSDLPSDAHEANVTFDNGRLQLVGWRFFDEWNAATLGWSQPHRSYAVELFWQITAPTNGDYEFYLAYIQDGTRYAARDSAIGGISYPPTPTSMWQLGTIYSEIVGFKFPQDIPSARTGTIRVGVYRSDGEPDDPTRPIYPIPTDGSEPDVVIQPLAVFDNDAPPTRIEGLTPVDAIFGDLIALHETGIPERSARGETVTMNFHWEALRDVITDYTLFIHIIDAEGNRVSGYDGLVGGTLISSTWQPSYPVYESIAIQLPDTSGIFPVYIGLYNLATLERLGVDAPDNRLLIGQIVVE